MGNPVLDEEHDAIVRSLHQMVLKPLNKEKKVTQAEMKLFFDGFFHKVDSHVCKEETISSRYNIDFLEMIQEEHKNFLNKVREYQERLYEKNIAVTLYHSWSNLL